jgi:cytochrome b pre-mRNA-processing protein 3
MIFRLFRRTPRPDTIAGLYGVIVAQARRPTFYRDYGVPDTVNGRFELVVLHLFLVLRRLAQETALPREIGQALFDYFCGDMDANLREMGVGDLAVPKTMRRIGEAFYDRQAAYGSGLTASGDRGLAATLARNIWGDETASLAGLTRLVAYVRLLEQELAGQDAEAVSQGTIAFPDPAAVLESACES